MPATTTTTWTLSWPHGEAQLQSLAGMLAPVTFRLADGRLFQPMQIAPWADEPGTEALPALMQRLRGDWACVPFGRDDRPAGLPADWPARATNASEPVWVHGYGSHHHWHLVHQDSHRLRIAIDYPEASAIARLERELVADPAAASLEVNLTIAVRRAVTVQVALHPTFRLPRDPRSVHLEQVAFDRLITYPVPAEPGISQLLPNTVGSSLAQVTTKDGSFDLTRLPLPLQTEELLQLIDCRPPVVLHYRAEDARIGLWWDQAQLPDAMLWISNGGRDKQPWNNRHYALGVEPLNGGFDIGQVATPPAGHPLAARRGLDLTPDHPRTIHARLAAW
jgi:hypothetical protein